MRYTVIAVLAMQFGSRVWSEKFHTREPAEALVAELKKLSVFRTVMIVEDEVPQHDSITVY